VKDTLEPLLGLAKGGAQDAIELATVIRVIARRANNISGHGRNDSRHRLNTPQKVHRVDAP